MLASEAVACLERDLEAARAEIVSLRAQLAARDVEPHEGPPWYGEVRLTPTHVAIMELLRSAPDEAVAVHRIKQVLPTPNPTDGAVTIHVFNIKKRLGPDAIETVGASGPLAALGYRLGRKYRTKPERTEP